MKREDFLSSRFQRRLGADSGRAERGEGPLFMVPSGTPWAITANSLLWGFGPIAATTHHSSTKSSRTDSFIEESLKELDTCCV